MPVAKVFLMKKCPFHSFWHHREMESVTKLWLRFWKVWRGTSGVLTTSRLEVEVRATWYEFEYIVDIHFVVLFYLNAMSFSFSPVSSGCWIDRFGTIVFDRFWLFSRENMRTIIASFLFLPETSRFCIVRVRSIPISKQSLLHRHFEQCLQLPLNKCHFIVECCDMLRSLRLFHFFRIEHIRIVK